MRKTFARIMLACVLGLVAFGLFTRHQMTPAQASDPATELTAVAEASGPEVAEPPPPPPTREDVIAKDSGLLESAGKHLVESRKKLKKYYATADDVMNMNSELTDVRAVILRHSQGDKQDQD
jgi:hypothetical protein